MKKILGKYKRLIYLGIISCFLFLLAGLASATSCWEYNTQAACSGNAECNWKSDTWGGWCEQKGCWNFFAQNTCVQSNNINNASYFINKSCSWQATSSTGWCTQLDCWSFDGTNNATCEGNSQGIKCEWLDTYSTNNYNYPCQGPPEKNCWSNQNQTACTTVTGCKWGRCDKVDCMDHNTKALCDANTGFNGRTCAWNSQYQYCYEGGCWDYSNKTTCTTNGCKWDGGWCSQYWCSDYSYNNSNYCVNNTANLSCKYNANGWCEDKGCWNYATQGQCGNQTKCTWQTASQTGWCQEAGCWNWNNASANDCVANGTAIGKNCMKSFPIDNWCIENLTAKQECTTINSEKDCMDTFYCRWNSTSSACNNPSQIATDFIEWNPGCYIFDNDGSKCVNVTGCFWNTTDTSCDTNLNIIPDGQINCTLIVNNTLCNKMSMLGSCCQWQGATCKPDKFSTKCWDEMQEAPEGAQYCEDYVAYTSYDKCMQIAGDPWFMPCAWDNSTERCKFKDTEVFGSGEKNIMKIDNKKNCEVAGGKWITESYCEGSDAISTGRCEMKFDEERNCDKECYACDYKTDKSNWTSADKAKTACVESALGFCKFTTDSGAPNGYGYCKPADEVKNGLSSGNCNTDCSACTYMGDSQSSKAENKPSYFCKNSDDKCKWIADLDSPTDESKGRCAPQSEKTCEDKCDKCGTETFCTSKGAKKGNNSLSQQCKWESNMCIPTTGAGQMEVCWDGSDNNADGKIDCADSMCWSDQFCGGGFMGSDCFGYSDNASCANNNCVWMNETWGTWCDMAGAVCWKSDGTNNETCEATSQCSWHNASGGFCEDNWSKTDSCMGKNQASCTGNGCVWSIDTWCQDVGGQCMSEPGYTGAWVDCWMTYGDGRAGGVDKAGCEASAACDWVNDTWCSQQSSNSGWCDHISFTCWQNNNNDTCGNAIYAPYCVWKADPYSGNSFCESRNTGSTGGGCFSYNNANACNTGGCVWESGFCDPLGFGSDTFNAGGAATGGFGTNCFEKDGNETACINQTGCGWFDEQRPFCDMNFGLNCPAYSYNSATCSQTAGCIWNNVSSFCDNAIMGCFWNTSLSMSQANCSANPLCNWTNNQCQPACFNAQSAASCSATSSQCKWISGWCNPAMVTQYFGTMDKNPPTPLGTDPADVSVDDVVDITGFGMKDMDNSYGLGISVVSFNDAAACYGVKLNGASGTGTRATKFYWYLDTDGSSTNNCDSQNDASVSGFEFFFSQETTFDAETGSANEILKRYKCSASGSWVPAEIATTSSSQKMCQVIEGGMIAIDKTELEKYSELYNSSKDMRVYVTSANATGNSSSPSDVVSTPGYATLGAMDFSFDDFDLFKYETDSSKKATKEGMDKGFKQYGEDADCWTQAGCANWICKGTPFCDQNNYGVESSSYSDTKTPIVSMMYKEVYPNSAFVALFTDKPANGTFKFYNQSSTCEGTPVSIYSNITKLQHKFDIFNDSGATALNYSLQARTTYYYRIKICDSNNKCAESKCSSLVTESSEQMCGFCKFVTRVKAPTGWNVYYDLGADGTYEHVQGQMCGTNAGMKTNYTTGRRANIRLQTTDNTSYIEFVNVRLTKTGLSTKTRDIETSGSLKNGTTTTTAGATIGYAGMIESTRDKIVNNLFPEMCFLRIPGTGTCTALWHCNTNLTNCVDRTNAAGVSLNTTGSDYCIWKIPCEFSVWAGGQPGTPTTTTSTTTSSGGGGGSGGGQAATATDFQRWKDVKMGQQAIMTITSSKIPVKAIVFVTNKDVSDVKVTVETLSEKPEAVSEASDKVFNYLKISAENLSESDLESVSMNITVNRTWLSENSIDVSDVVMYRHADGKWVGLETKLALIEVNNVKYEVKTPGFSYFAIAKRGMEAVTEEESAGEEEVTGETVREDAAEEGEATEPEKAERGRSFAVLYVLGAILLVAIIVAIALGLRKKEAPPAKKKK